MLVLDGQLLQGGGLLFLDGGLYGAENAVEYCKDPILVIAPNSLGQKVLIFLQ